MFSFVNFAQASETSWMGLVPFAGVCSLHDRLLKVVDRTPDKTVGAKIRDGLTVGSAAYLITSPCLFPNEPEKTKMYRSLAGITLMFGHLGYRFYNKSETMPQPVVTVAATGIAPASPFVGLGNFGSRLIPVSLAKMQEKSNETP